MQLLKLARTQLLGAIDKTVSANRGQARDLELDWGFRIPAHVVVFDRVVDARVGLAHASRLTPSRRGDDTLLLLPLLLLLGGVAGTLLAGRPEDGRGAGHRAKPGRRGGVYCGPVCLGQLARRLEPPLTPALVCVRDAGQRLDEEPRRLLIFVARFLVQPAGIVRHLVLEDAVSLDRPPRDFGKVPDLAVHLKDHGRDVGAAADGRHGVSVLDAERLVVEGLVPAGNEHRLAAVLFLEETAHVCRVHHRGVVQIVRHGRPQGVVRWVVHLDE